MAKDAANEQQMSDEEVEELLAFDFEAQSKPKSLPKLCSLDDAMMLWEMRKLGPEQEDVTVFDLARKYDVPIRKAKVKRGRKDDNGEIPEHEAELINGRTFPRQLTKSIRAIVLTVAKDEKHPERNRALQFLRMQRQKLEE